MRETWVQSLGWKIPWTRERLPTPVLWPGEFHVLYSPRDHKELDMTERCSLPLPSGEHLETTQIIQDTLPILKPINLTWSAKSFWPWAIRYSQAPGSCVWISLEATWPPLYLLEGKIVNLLPENWAHLLVGVRPNDTTKPEIKRREDSLLFQLRRTPVIFPKAVSLEQQNWGSFKLRVHAYSWRGLGKGEFSIALGPRSTELWLIDIRKANIIIPLSTQVGALVSIELKEVATVRYNPWGGSGILFYCLTIVSWLPFLCSCISTLPLRTLITEPCWRASLVARPKSQDGFRLKMAFFGQESHAWFPFSEDLLSAYKSTSSFTASLLVIAQG